MATGDQKLVYGTPTAITTTNVASLATSSTWVAGRALTAVSNTTDLVLDRIIDGLITVGTTPTTNTIIEIWVIPLLGNGNWPDTFGGTDAAVTATTRTVLTNYAGLLASISVDSNTSNRAYPFCGSVVTAMRGIMPRSMQIWVTHNTGVNLNSTAGNQVIYHTPVYASVAT